MIVNICIRVSKLNIIAIIDEILKNEESIEIE